MSNRKSGWYYSVNHGGCCRGARIKDEGILWRVIFNGGEPDFTTPSFSDALDKIREYVDNPQIEVHPGDAVLKAIRDAAGEVH